MSWDIAAYVPGDGHQVRIEGADWNYTHNTNGMIREAGFPEWGPEAIESMSGAGMRDKLRVVVANLQEDWLKYDEMNPTNGWGSRSTLVPVLQEMLEVAAKYPSCRWSASF